MLADVNSFPQGATTPYLGDHNSHVEQMMGRDARHRDRFEKNYCFLLLRLRSWYCWGLGWGHSQLMFFRKRGDTHGQR